MNKERFMKDFNGEKVFCLENDKETFRDMVFELQQRIDKAIEYINSFDEIEIRFIERENLYEMGIGEYTIKQRLKKDKTLEGQFVKINREYLLDILKGSDSND